MSWLDKSVNGNKGIEFIGGETGRGFEIPSNMRNYEIWKGRSAFEILGENSTHTFYKSTYPVIPDEVSWYEKMLQEKEESFKESSKQLHDLFSRKLTEEDYEHIKNPYGNVSKEELDEKFDKTMTELGWEKS